MRNLTIIMIVASILLSFGTAANAVSDTMDIQKQHNAQIEQLLAAKGF